MRQRIKDNQDVVETGSCPDKLSQQWTMNYLLTESYVQEVEKYLNVNGIEHRMIRVHSSNDDFQQGNSLDKNSNDRQQYCLLECGRQLESMKLNHANLLTQEYRNSSLEEGITLEGWLAEYAIQIGCKSNYHVLNNENTTITVAELKSMLERNQINTNLLDSLINHQFHVKKIRIIEARQFLDVQIKKTQETQRQVQKQYQQPERLRLQTIIKNLELRLATVAKKKNIKFVSQKQQKPSNLTNKQVQGLCQPAQLQRVKTVISNGMWGCLPQIQERMKKLNQVRTKFAEDPTVSQHQ